MTLKGLQGCLAVAQLSHVLYLLTILQRKLAFPIPSEMGISNLRTVYGRAHIHPLHFAQGMKGTRGPPLTHVKPSVHRLNKDAGLRQHWVQPNLIKTRACSPQATQLSTHASEWPTRTLFEEVCPITEVANTPSFQYKDLGPSSEYEWGNAMVFH